MSRPPVSKLHTLLLLGRVSNLPTVCANCAAGWWLAGGGPWAPLIGVAVWVSCLYIGGMFLNDAFDAGFDRNNRPTRPIPSGMISEAAVWAWGVGWLAAGLIGLVWMGRTTAVLAVLLAFCIMIYNAIHKIVVVAPVVMGACRFLVYLTAASVAVNGIAGEAVWKGMALALYVVGLSYLARNESGPVRIQYWPGLLLLAPVCVALLFDDAGDKWAASLCAMILLGWAVWTYLQAHGKEHPNVGQAVARLLAGIALVDLLAVAQWHFATILFVLCFFLALALQRYVPAT